MAVGKETIIVLLFGISLINYIDRWSVAGILNDLQAPLKDGGFELSDTEGGLVTSVFIVSYMICSPIFGFFGDRMPRKELIFLGIVIWAASTLMASFATIYWQFLLFRGLVGVGEASYAVLAPTIIADLYSGPERTRVLGYYCASIPLGSAIGYVYAGEVARILNWRWAFRLTVPVSLTIGSFMLCFVQEPTRGSLEGVAPDDKSRQGCTGFLKDIRDIIRVRSYLWSTLGSIGMTFVAGALASFAPAYLQRVNCSKDDADCESQINLVFGGITMITGISGTLLGAWLSKCYSKVNAAADALVSAFGLLAATPCVFLSIKLAPKNMHLTWILIAVGETFVSFTWAPLTAILLSVVSPYQRGQANGMQLLAMHLLGDSVSPVFVGLAADRLYNHGKGLARANALQRALSLTVLWCILGAVCFIMTSVSLISDRAKAQAGVQDLPESTDGQGAYVLAETTEDPD